MYDAHKTHGDADISSMTDTQLLEYATQRDQVTPLENELAQRLEVYVTIFGDVNEVGEL